MNLLAIKKISEEKGITLKSIAERICMSTANLHKCFKGNRIEAGDLEKIAQILEVPISCFFDEPQSTIPKAMKSCQGCKDKEKIIKVLEANVKLLEDKVHYLGDMLEKAGIQSKRAS